MDQNKPSTALTNLDRCYELRKKMGNPILNSEVLYYLIFVHLQMENENELDKYFKEIQKISNKSDNKTIKLRARMAEAMVLHSHSRIVDKAKAQDLFEKVLADGIIDNELTIFAMLNLCEFLILELKTTGEKEVLIELNVILDQLYKIAAEQESHILIVEILIIQSKLFLADFDFNEATTHLEQALYVADTNELSHQKVKISYLQNQIHLEINKYRDSTQKVDFLNRVEQLEIEGYIRSIADIASSDLTNFTPSDPTESDDNELGIANTNVNLANLLLQDKTLPEEMKRFVHFLNLSLSEIQLLYSTYVLVDKIDQQEYKINATEINLAQLIRDELDLFIPRLNQNEVDVLLDFPEIDVLLTTDRHILRRCLQNLFQNAAKFTPQAGSIEIIIQRDPAGWVIKISNNCQIIELNDLTVLFDKFSYYPADDLSKKGLGIGLYFVRRASEMLQWELHIASPAVNLSDGFQVTWLLTSYENPTT